VNDEFRMENLDEAGGYAGEGKGRIEEMSLAKKWLYGGVRMVLNVCDA